jgi:ribosomal protein L32
MFVCSDCGSTKLKGIVAMYCGECGCDKIEIILKRYRWISIFKRQAEYKQYSVFDLPHKYSKEEIE